MGISDFEILGVLKFLGFAVAFAAAIWGALREYRKKARNGPKRLSPAGYVAIAFAVVGTLVSVAALGFEMLAEQQARRNSELERTRQAVYDLQMEQRAKRLLDQQALARAESLGQAAEARANRAEERIERLRVANEQRERDVALARTVNVRSGENLERTQAALSQIERSLYPLGEVVLSIIWQIPGNSPGLSRELSQLNDYVRQINEAPFDPSNPDSGDRGLVQNVRRHPETGRIMFIEIREDSRLYPGSFSRSSLRSMLELFRPFLMFHGDAAGLREFDAIHGRVPDLYLGLQPPSRFSYSPNDGSIVVETRFSGQVPPSPTGRLVSIPDMERATLTLSRGDMAEGPFAQVIRPIGGSLEIGGRHYMFSFNQSGFRRGQDRAGRAIWQLDQLPPPH